MIALDEREQHVDGMLRAGGARLRSAMASASVPELRQRRQSHRRGWLVGIATAAVVIVGLVAIGSSRNERGASNDPNRLRWIVTDLPAGWKPQIAFDPSVTGAAGSPTLGNVYATQDVLNGPLLSVEGSDEGTRQIPISPANGSETNLQQMSVGERRAVIADGASGVRVLYVDIDGHWVRMRARNLDDESLRKIAETLEWADGIAAVPLEVLPDGLALLASALDPIDPALNPQLGAGVAVTHYSNESNPFSAIRFTVSVLRPATLAFAALQDELKPVKIGSTSGWSFELHVNTLFGGHTLYWERDGLAFSLTGRQVQDSMLVAAASSARPATDAEWRAIPNADAGAPAATVAVEGTYPVGFDASISPDSGVPFVTDAAPAETVPAETIPTFNAEPRDVALDITVTNPSSYQQTWSGTLPGEESWSVDITTVYDSIRVVTAIDGTPTGGFYGESLPRPPEAELGCCNPINVITADKRALALRVVRSNGDRYTIELHDLPGDLGLRIAVVALPVDSPGQLVELIDGAGKVLQTLP